MFIAALFIIAKLQKPKCPSRDKQIKKCIYTREYDSAIKKNEILPSAPIWMDLEDIVPGEMSQTEKDKYQMTSLTCGI